MFFVPLVLVGAIGLAFLLRPWPLFPAPKSQGLKIKTAISVNETEHESSANGCNARRWLEV